MRRRGGNAVVPGDDVPDNRPDQRAKNDVVIDNGRINGPFADGFGDRQLEQKIGQKIEGCRPDHRLMRFENPGRNDGGNRVGRIVKTVHEIEQQGDDDQGNDDPEADL
jgi:hypothetical protein